jgi:hypothetical protein
LRGRRRPPHCTPDQLRSARLPAEQTLPPATDACPNCSAPLIGRYCHACGQKRIEPEERRFTWFVGQLLREVALVDGRLARSLARLLFRPGTLDRDWLAGRRRRNTAPLNLFLLANLVYFFYPPLTDLNLGLYDQFRQPLYGTLADGLVRARTEARGIGIDEYASAYFRQATSLAKTMVILHVPLLAAVLAGLFMRRRIFYVDHIAVALHFWAFLLFHAMATPPLLAAVLPRIGIESAAVFQLLMIGVILLYAWQQLRVGYATRWWSAAARVPLFFVGFVLSHLLFRFVQFVLVFATT